MAYFKLITFGGKAPRVSPRLLADNLAQTATDVNLESGRLVPVKDNSTVDPSNGVSTLANTTKQTIFKYTDSPERWLQFDEDVDVVRFPALWNNLMKIHAQVYYTAEALDKLDVLHTPVFNAINLQGNRLQNERQIGSLFAGHGVTAEDFEKAFNSFSVKTKVNQAEKRMQDYQIRSTPNMIVNGKYLVATGQNVPTQEEMLEVVEFLVEKERRTLGSSGE